eukprot:TRINITY_DN13732_c0_g1_i1.p1 TRINITY_DN13732_c0_g1~~TRINITY_DN13732_c0_g1_i1.p1  ORF type:complete len:398 (+),score=89.23 TRINITY_DN13732_c0_g1_i1:36-1196(+)
MQALNSHPNSPPDENILDTMKRIELGVLQKIKNIITRCNGLRMVQPFAFKDVTQLAKEVAELKDEVEKLAIFIQECDVKTVEVYEQNPDEEWDKVTAEMSLLNFELRFQRERLVVCESDLQQCQSELHEVNRKLASRESDDRKRNGPDDVSLMVKQMITQTGHHDRLISQLKQQKLHCQECRSQLENQQIAQRRERRKIVDWLLYIIFSIPFPNRDFKSLFDTLEETERKIELELTKLKEGREILSQQFTDKFLLEAEYGILEEKKGLRKTRRAIVAKEALLQVRVCDIRKAVKTLELRLDELERKAAETTPKTAERKTKPAVDKEAIELIERAALSLESFSSQLEFQTGQLLQLLQRQDTPPSFIILQFDVIQEILLPLTALCAE